MKKRFCLLTGAVTLAAVTAAVAGAETCRLEIKKVDTASAPMSRAERRFRSTVPQSFFMQIGESAGMVPKTGDKEKPRFFEIIKKEPSKYEAARPFRGVAALGGGYYGFVFDAAPPKKAKQEGRGEEAGEQGDSGNAKSEKKPLKELLTPGLTPLDAKPAGPSPVAYSRLHFDVNHNGDLTDDPVVDATLITKAKSGSVVYAWFPRIDLTIDVGGKKVDYAFRSSVKSQSSGNLAYATASLDAAAYRTGEMTLGGKKLRVIVVDYNSNGVFNDAFTVDDPAPKTPLSLATASRRCDRWFAFDPESDSTAVRSPNVVTRDNTLNIVSGLVRFNDAFYNLTITPAGDELTLTPASTPLGYVTNPNGEFQAVVYGKRGVLKITNDETGRASLPEGQWRLMSYSIDRTVYEERKEPPAKNDAKGEEKTGEKPKRPASARVIPPVRYPTTIAYGRAAPNSKPVDVTAGKTVGLPFGPPYRPVVSVRSSDSKEGRVSLDLSLVGAGGDVCRGLYVNGRPPTKPEFTITTDDGKKVAGGAFEYG